MITTPELRIADPVVNVKVDITEPRTAARIVVTTYPNKTDTTPRRESLTRPELVARMLVHAERPTKDGEMHSPARIFPGKTRANESVNCLDYLVADFDHLTPDQVGEALDRFAALEYAAYTTHSHTPESPRFRVIIPIDAPIPAHDWKEGKRLQPRIWELFGPLADQGTTAASQAYYMPSHAPGAPYWGEHHHGAILDPYALPEATTPPRAARAATTAQGEPIGEGGRNAYMVRVAGSLRRTGCTQGEIVGSLLLVNERCAPPLPEPEVRAIAASAARYAPVPEAELVNAAIVARLDQAEAALSELRALQSKTMAVLRNGNLRGERVTAVAATFEIASAVSRGEGDAQGYVKVYVPAMAANVGISARACSTHLDHLAEWGMAKKSLRTAWHRDIDHETGEVSERPRNELWVRLEAPPVETLDRLITFEPPRDDKRGGRRVVCPDHPDAAIIHRHHCGVCNRLLDVTVSPPPCKVCIVGNEGDVPPPEGAHTHAPMAPTPTLQSLHGGEIRTDAEEFASLPEHQASVPFVFTRQMEADLKSIGYSQAEINKLTPAEGWERIKNTPPEVCDGPVPDWGEVGHD